MDIQNSILGLQAVLHSMLVSLHALALHPLLWGVGIGFAISTAVHAIIVSRSPAAYYHMVTKTPKDSYAKIHPLFTPHTPSFEEFQRDHHHVLILLRITITALLTLALVAVVVF
jgi:hypothetical protein